MKTFQKTMLSVVLTLCLLAVSVCGVLAEATALDLMPTADSGYTIVAGDGTVTIADGKMTLVNNGDGDFRVTIDNKAAFDLNALHTLHMNFNAEMPFKMAYYMISDADGSSDWLNTSTDFTDLYTVDTATDRAAAGEYDVKMKLGELALDIADKSSVHFDQFIILLTGKGTFTLNTMAMTDGTSAPAGDSDATTTEAPEGDATTTTQAAGDADATTTAAGETTTAAPTTTTVPKPAGDTESSAKTGDVSDAIAFAAVAAVAAVVVTLSVVSKKSKAR